MDIVDELFELGGSMQQCITHGKAIVEIERLREELTKLDKDIEELKKTIETLEEEVYVRTSDLTHVFVGMNHKE
jgi:predicted  nucleic acid-binding Zn-ribbon protein